MKPLLEERACGMVDPRVLGVIVIYSLGGRSQLPPCCVLVWGLFLNVSSYEEKTGCTRETSS